MADPLTGDFAGLGKLEANLYKLSTVPSQAATEAAEGIQSLVMDEYASGSDPNGRRWAPLRPSTLKRGRTPPPLTDSGNMRDGTEVKPLPGAGISISFDVPYAVFHHTGTRNMVARPVAPTGTFPASWNEVIEAAIEAAAERRMAGK